jgi:aerobic-type carbon monoxide dehydrogenase small subunit (CoxS/CutS family)
MLKELKLTVNGQPYELSIHPRALLVEVLRENLGLTGTKRGCNEGACGACTVVMNGKSVKACSVLALSANGAEITTVEGLAKGARTCTRCRKPSLITAHISAVSVPPVC